MDTLILLLYAAGLFAAVLNLFVVLLQSGWQLFTVRWLGTLVTIGLALTI